MNVMYRFLGIWLLVACALCFASCGKAYYNVIPESSPAIASFDFTQMASEAGEDAKALTDILPLKSGIDFSQPAYGFISPNGYYGVVVAVNDEDDLAREIQKSHDFSAVDRSSDLHWALWKSNWQWAWNDEALLMLGPVVAGEQSFMRRTVSAMFNSSKGIDRSPLFESLEKQGGNAKMVARLSCLPALLRGMLALQCSGSVDADSVILESSCIIADGGRIVMDNELKTTDGGNPAKASGLKQYNGGMSGERLAGNTKAFMLMGMDGEKFAERLGSEKSAKGLFAVLKSTTVMGKVIAAIRGDALFSLEDIDKDGNVSLHIVADVKDPAFMDSISQYKKNNPQEHIVKTPDGGYECRVGGKYFAFGIRKDGKLVCRYGKKAELQGEEKSVQAFAAGAKGEMCHAKFFLPEFVGTPFSAGLLGGKTDGLLRKYSGITYSFSGEGRSKIVLEPIKQVK